MTTVYPANEGPATQVSEGREKDILQQCRDEFDYQCKAWKETWDQAEKDDRALSIAGCWTDEERDERAVLKRPCLHLDILTQYIHSLVNEVRNNPISIKVQPGDAEEEKSTADLRASRIRGIEYESNGTYAMRTAFESAARRSFGAFGIGFDYKSWDSFEKVIKFRHFSNSYAVVPDFDSIEPAFSDQKCCFVLSRVRKEDFESLYPDAQITSFGNEESKIAKGWFDDDSIQVAEYWYTKSKPRTMYQVQLPDGMRTSFLKGEPTKNIKGLKGEKVAGRVLLLQDGSQLQLLNVRKTLQTSIHMIKTNGLEVLEPEIEWPGKWIPIIPVIAEELYLRSGNRVKRVLQSYIRMARDAQQLGDYYVSNEAEVVSSATKAPYVGYEGQFNTQTDWANIHKIPTAYVEAKATTDEVPNALLPLPQQQIHEPPIQALEIGKESARRAAQAAIGSYGFTRLDDTNVKSGIALENLKQSNDLASYHIIDNYKMSITHAGRIINDLLDDVESEPMLVGLQDLEGNYSMGPVNRPDQTGQMQKYRLTDESQYEVTLSTGQSFQSQRDEANMIVENLISNMKSLPLQPVQAQKLLALLIQLKNLGPLGDKMRQIIDPQDDQQQISPQAQQMIAQTKQEAQAINNYAKQLETQLADLKQQIDSKKLDNETKLKIAAMEGELEKFKITMTAMTAHEQMTSDENRDAAKINAQGMMAQVEAKISAINQRQQQLADSSMAQDALESKERMQLRQQDADAQQAEAERQAAAQAQSEQLSAQDRQQAAQLKAQASKPQA